MSIAVECGKCGHQVQAPNSAAGKVGKCRECGESLRVPKPGRTLVKAVAGLAILGAIGAGAYTMRGRFLPSAAADGPRAYLPAGVTGLMALDIQKLLTVRFVQEALAKAGSDHELMRTLQLAGLEPKDVGSVLIGVDGGGLQDGTSRSGLGVVRLLKDLAEGGLEAAVKSDPGQPVATIELSGHPAFEIRSEDDVVVILQLGPRSLAVGDRTSVEHAAAVLSGERAPVALPEALVSLCQPDHRTELLWSCALNDVVAAADAAPSEPNPFAPPVGSADLKAMLTTADYSEAAGLEVKVATRLADADKASEAERWVGMMAPMAAGLLGLSPTEVLTSSRDGDQVQFRLTLNPAAIAKLEAKFAEISKAGPGGAGAGVTGGGLGAVER